MSVQVACSALMVGSASVALKPPPPPTRAISPPPPRPRLHVITVCNKPEDERLLTMQSIARHFGTEVKVVVTQEYRGNWQKMKVGWGAWPLLGLCMGFLGAGLDMWAWVQRCYFSSLLIPAPCMCPPSPLPPPMPERARLLPCPDGCRCWRGHCHAGGCL